MTNLIGFSGYIGSGKDLAAELTQSLLQNSDDTMMGFPTWQIKKFSSKLRQIASLLTGHSPNEFESRTLKDSYLEDFSMTVRELLQKLGTDAIRDHVHKDAWVKALFSDYQPTSNWLISDVRFVNEAAEIKRRGGVIIRLNRANPISDHQSEIALDNYTFDYVINNTGTKKELQKQLELILYKRIAPKQSA